MKTMTCSQLGGPCATEHQGASADDIINAQDAHLQQTVAAGDTSHEAAAAAMKGRWKNPLKGMGWYRGVKREFAAQPEN